MFNLTTTLSALVLLSILAVFVPFFLRWLAEENIFFTTVKEGSVKAIMRGKTFDHFIMSFAGYHLNDPRKKKFYKPEIGKKNDKDETMMEKLPDWEIVYHGIGNKKGFEINNDLFYDGRPWLLRKLGLYWVGWPWAMSVYVYQFEWNETYTEKEGGEEKILPRAAPTDYIFIADFIYAIKTIGAETKERLPIDVLTLVTIAVRNPYRALFSGEDWMRRITAAINRRVRIFVGGKTYAEIVSTGGKNPDAENESEFSSPIVNLNTRLPNDPEGSAPSGLRGRYGVEIRTADLQTIDLSGDGKDAHQEAATRVYVAEQDAKATVLKGKATAEVIEMTGNKEALALAARLKVIKENGGEGMMLAQLDAMKESSKGDGHTVVWANNPFIPTAAVANLMKGDNT